MKELFVPVHVDGATRMQREYVYKMEELPFMDILMRHGNSTSRAKRKGSGGFYKVHYLECPAAFDIETTNIFHRKPDGSIDNTLRPYGFMYHWQVCIDKYVTFGRTWAEFQRFLAMVSNNLHLSLSERLVLWVHNLSFRVSVLQAVCGRGRRGMLFPGTV